MEPVEQHQSHRRFRFDGDLERIFQRDYYSRVRRPLRVGMLLGGLLLLLSATYYYLHGLLTPSLLTFFIAIFVVVILIFGLTYTRFFELWWQQTIVLSCLAMPFTQGKLVDAVYARPDLIGEAAKISHIGLVLCGFMTAFFVLCRLQFVWTALFQIALVSAAAWAALTRFEAPNVVTERIGLHILPILVVLIFAAYAQERLSRRAFLATRLLDIERAKTEALLHNVLPDSVAERLKASAATIADDFDQVSVLFADIVDFTPLAAHLPAPQVVSLLNDIFSAFDELAARHRVEKIKTIGDAYMVVSGVPQPRRDHVVAITDMALEMQDVIARFRHEGRALQLRIGMHTGPVVAGVIGTHRLTYDLWGDTVNMASRMQSHGQPGSIQVTEAMYRQLRDNYVFDEPRQVEIKGRGIVAAYSLLGRKAAERHIPPAASVQS